MANHCIDVYCPNCHRHYCMRGCCKPVVYPLSPEYLKGLTRNNFSCIYCFNQTTYDD